MTCDKTTELLSDYLDGCLDWDINIELENHINTCDTCTKELAELIKLTNRLKAMPKIDLPIGFHGELMEKCANLKHIRKRPKFLMNSWKIPASIAAAFFIFFILLSVYNIIPINNNSYESSAYYGYGYSTGTMNNQIAQSPAPASSPSYDVAEDTLEYDAFPETEESILISDDADISETAIADMKKEQQLNDAEASTESIEDTPQKIIKNSSVNLEVENFDDTVNFLKSLIEESGGYVDNLSSYINKTYLYNGMENGELKNGFIILKVPAAKYEYVKDSLPSLGKIINQNENVLDVTMDYIDHEARLSVKKTEEERLLRLMDAANKIDELILLEQRLANVRSDIESFERQLKSWDKQVGFSTIEINLSEKQKYEVRNISELTFMGQLKEGASYSLMITHAKLQYLIILLARNMIPILIIIVTFAIVIIFIFVRRRIKLKSNKK